MVCTNRWMAAMAAVADPAVRRRITDLGLDVPPPERQSAEALGELQRAEVEKWWLSSRRPTSRRSEVDPLAGTLLRCIIFSGRMSHMGQFLPPSFVAAMEELASTPDAKAHNGHASFDAMTVAIECKRLDRRTPITGRHGRRPWHLQRARCELMHRSKQPFFNDGKPLWPVPLYPRPG
jgi:hypothetical protein